MNLADMLSYADIKQLHRIADQYQCECDGHSKHELIQSILSKVYRKEGFQSMVHRLNDEDLRFLNSFLFESEKSFSLEELLARAKYTQFEEQPDNQVKPVLKRSKKKAKKQTVPISPSRETISRFKSRGWLFNGITKNNRYLFQFPEDLKERLSDILYKHFEQSLNHTSEPPIYREEGRLILEDISNFLRLVEHEDFPLTASGWLYKRSIHHIINSMAVPEEPVSHEVWRFGYGRRFKEYPNRLSFIYDYCYFHGYIKEGSILELTQRGQEKLFHQEQENPLDVYKFWIRLYKGPIYQLQGLVHWMDRMAEQWVTVDSLYHVLHRFIRPYYYDDARSILEKRMLNMMLHLGMITIGEHPEDGTVVRMTKRGRSMIRGIYVPEEDQVHLSLEEL